MSFAVTDLLPFLAEAPRRVSYFPDTLSCEQPYSEHSRTAVSSPCDLPSFWEYTGSGSAGRYGASVFSYFVRVPHFFICIYSQRAEFPFSPDRLAFTLSTSMDHLLEAGH